MRAVIGTALATALLCLSAFAPASRASFRSRLPSHDVVMHISSFRHDTVRVHLQSDSAGLRLASDSTTTPSRELTVLTPSDVWIGRAVGHLELKTDENAAVRIQFTRDASAVEGALKLWGRLLSFHRVDGNLEPVAKVSPITH